MIRPLGRSRGTAVQIGQLAEILNRKSPMREPGANSWIVQNRAGALSRTRRLAVVAFGLVLGIGLVMSAGVARAQDDEEDDKTFEEKIIDRIMAGVGGTNMENRGIDYRERSPLVVPPKLDLPPPEAAKSEVKDPNWPKDPDVARGKVATAARKTRKYETPEQAARIRTPSQLKFGRPAAPARPANDPVQRGASNKPIRSPAHSSRPAHGDIGPSGDVSTSKWLAGPGHHGPAQAGRHADDLVEGGLRRCDPG